MAYSKFGNTRSLTFVFPSRVDDSDYPKKLLAISYTLLGTVGFVASIATGILISLVTGKFGSHDTISEELRAHTHTHTHTHTHILLFFLLGISYTYIAW